MDYRKLLEDGYADYATDDEGDASRLAYLSLYVFDFTTYDRDMDELLAGRALDVCRVIANRTNRDFIADPESYKWFIIMCNMPFFCGRLDWGTSIRGAWWSAEQPAFSSCGLWLDNRQVTEPLVFRGDDWIRFMAAVLAFADAAVAGPSA